MNPTFSSWVHQWWQKFDSMDVGTAYEVSKCAKDPELFIEICKNFIDYAENGMFYEFSNDYKFFKRFTYADSEITYGLNHGYIKK